MASHQDTRQSVIDREWRRKLAFNRNERIDPSIAGNVQFPWRPLSSKICGCELSWCEEQVGTGVDRNPVFLLRPREERVVGSEARLHVCHRNACGESRKRASQRTRGVALHDDEVGGRPQSRKEPAGDVPHVHMRICFAGTAELHGIEPTKHEVTGIEIRMLTGQHQHRQNAPIGKSVRDRC